MFAQNLRTSVTIVSFNGVRCKLWSNVAVYDDQSKLYLEKTANAAEKIFADQALFDL